MLVASHYPCVWAAIASLHLEASELSAMSEGARDGSARSLILSMCVGCGGKPAARRHSSLLCVRASEAAVLAAARSPCV